MRNWLALSPESEEFILNNCRVITALPPALLPAAHAKAAPLVAVLVLCVFVLVLCFFVLFFLFSIEAAWLLQNVSFISSLAVFYH